MEAKVGLSSGRERSKNFKETEVQLLLDLVFEKKNILENKKCDHVTYKEKEKVWIWIEDEFNKASGIYFRDWKTLKVKYDNLKKTSKRKWADEKMYELSTGTDGGPSQASTLSQTDFKIKDLIGETQICEKLSSFDSDDQLLDEKLYTELPSTQNPANSTSNFEIGLGPDVFDIPVILEAEIPMKEHAYSKNDISSSTLTNTSGGKFNIETSSKKNFKIEDNPQILNSGLKLTTLEGFDNHFSIKRFRSKTLFPLKVKNRKAAPLDKTCAGQKIELLTKRKQSLLELHKVSLKRKMRFEEEEYELRKKNMKDEHELRTKNMKEEHEKKMILLDLQIKSEILKLSHCVD